MRRVLAWVLLAVGLVGGLTGAALLTVAAPADRLEVAVDSSTTDEPAVAVVTAPGLLDLSGPQVDVGATSADGAPVFLAVARAQDVDAWLGEARRTDVEDVAGDLAQPRAVTEVSGTGTAVDPRGADIWLATATGAGAARLTWPTGGDGDYRDAGGVVVLAATDGTAAAPARVSLSWQTEGEAAQHPAGVPLLAGGCVLALLGAVGVLLARAPRTPRSSRPAPRRRA